MKWTTASRRESPGSQSCQSNRMQGFVRGLGSGAHTIRHSDAAVSVAGEREAGELLQEAANPLQALQMADTVLRHGASPPGNAREEWLCGEVDKRPQVLTNHGDDLFIG